MSFLLLIYCYIPVQIMCLGVGVVAQDNKDSGHVVDANNTSTGYNITLEDILSISCNCTTDDASTTLPMQYIQCEYSGLKEDAGFSLEVLHYHGSIEQPVLMQTVWDQKKLESVGKDFDNRVLYNLNTETQDAWYKVPLNTSGAWYCVKLRQGSTLVESSVCKRKETEDGSWLDWFLENPIVTYTIIGLAVAIMLVTGIGIIVCAIKYCRRKNTNYSAVNRSENIAMNNVS